MTLERITIAIEDELLDSFEELLDRRNLGNRSEIDIYTDGLVGH